MSIEFFFVLFFLFIVILVAIEIDRRRFISYVNFLEKHIKEMEK